MLGTSWEMRDWNGVAVRRRSRGGYSAQFTVKRRLAVGVGEGPRWFGDVGGGDGEDDGEAAGFWGQDAHADGAFDFFGFGVQRFAFGVDDLQGQFAGIGVAAEEEPVFIAFEELGFDLFGLAGFDHAAPIILPDLKAFFDEGSGQFHGHAVGVIDERVSAGQGHQAAGGHEQGGGAEAGK